MSHRRKGVTYGLLGLVLFVFFSTVSALTKVKPLDLEWKDVSCSVGDKSILRGLSGKAGAGKLLAIMGPSGSGKTTLLNALSGQIPSSKKTKLYGTLRIGGEEWKEGQEQAYVKQQDVFYSQLTVRETLVMAARLRLPRSMPLEEKVAKVEELLNRLGLAKVADTIVGDEKTRGISGGEKKRLSIACQLFGTPSLIFCDEPTTGLDSFQAERVMSTLRQLAEDGHTVICSIHQPRSSIFRMFDDLLVLSEGRVLFHGPAGQVAKHFRSMGHAMPPNTNPGEFAIDVVSVDYTSKETEEDSRERISLLAAAFAASPALAKMPHGGGVGEVQQERRAARPSVGGSAVRRLWGMVRAGGGILAKGKGNGRAGPMEQFRLLLSRSWRQVNRAKFANVARVMANLGSAVIFGSIFWKLGMGQTHINDRIGLLQTAAIQCAMSTVVKTLTTFPTESTIVKAERSLNMYGVMPYFLSKIIAELPVSALFPNIFGVILYNMTGLHPKRERMLKFLGILTVESFAASAIGMAVGAIARDEDTALALGPALMTVFILFSGFYISQDNIPRVLRWVKDASIIKHSFEGFCVNELRGLEFQCDTLARGPCIRTGEQMLARVAFDKSTVTGATAGLGKILGGAWFCTYLALALGSPRFQAMMDPSALGELESAPLGMPVRGGGDEGTSYGSKCPHADRSKRLSRLTRWIRGRGRDHAAARLSSTDSGVTGFGGASPCLPVQGTRAVRTAGIIGVVPARRTYQ